MAPGGFFMLAIFIWLANSFTKNKIVQTQK
jgi:hypothetical protein